MFDLQDSVFTSFTEKAMASLIPQLKKLKETKAAEWRDLGMAIFSSAVSSTSSTPDGQIDLNDLLKDIESMVIH
jgi:hypothetical protein